MKAAYRAIPTNIVTGFLGAGKTTAIRWLLAHKPDGETWAVLVNEFGEIGIDGSLLNPPGRRDDRVFVRELPGGCLCCSAGVPFQTALNQLIKSCHPDRIVIEPTGLGHPREVAGMLTAGFNSEIIDLRAILTLVDARKFGDERYTRHEIFVQQLQVADRIVATKRDLYQGHELRLMRDFLMNLGLSTPVSDVMQGQLPTQWLQREKRVAETACGRHVHMTDTDIWAGSEPVDWPACGYRRVESRGGGFFSVGWLFAPHLRFHFNRLHTLLLSIVALRLKGIFRTERGVFVFNASDGEMQVSTGAGAADSRLEVVSADQTAWRPLETGLLAAVADKPVTG